MPVKLGATFVVIALNYVISKLIVFKKPGQSENLASEE